MLKINRPDSYLSWSGLAKPYMEITCSGRATVWTTVPHRPDAALKQARFQQKSQKFSVAQLSVQTAMTTVRTAPVLFKVLAHLPPSL
jgi:hypothetical protein